MAASNVSQSVWLIDRVRIGNEELFQREEYGGRASFFSLFHYDGRGYGLEGSRGCGNHTVNASLGLDLDLKIDQVEIRYYQSGIVPIPSESNESDGGSNAFTKDDRYHNKGGAIEYKGVELSAVYLASERHPDGLLLSLAARGVRASWLTGDVDETDQVGFTLPPMRYFGWLDVEGGARWLASGNRWLTSVELGFYDNTPPRHLDPSIKHIEGIGGTKLSFLMELDVAHQKPHRIELKLSADQLHTYDVSVPNAPNIKGPIRVRNGGILEINPTVFFAPDGEAIFGVSGILGLVFPGEHGGLHIIQTVSKNAPSSLEVSSKFNDWELRTMLGVWVQGGYFGRPQVQSR